MKVIVGLGNPGKEYANTRHNIGWYCLDKFLGDVDWTKKFNSAIYETNINGEKYIFVKPLTYMNLSGNAVGEIANFYKLDYLYYPILFINLFMISILYCFYLNHIMF